MLGHGSLLAYLVHMTLRIVEIHRVLKPTGSFYLHCDPTASHYLKLVLDAVFCGQGGEFRNEISWKRTSGHSDAIGYGRVRDVLLFYTKTQVATWNDIYQPYTQQYTDQYYRYKDGDGRRWMSDNLSAAGLSGGGYQYEWHGHNKLWRCPPETMARLEVEGRIYYTKNGIARRKRYLDESKGLPAQDSWDDIQALRSWHAERLGYDTQKPEALLERIINASSNEGDTILDAYCGCGTTVAVAQRLNRKWIGIDITYQSIALILKRFQDTYEKNGTWPAVEANIMLDGVPRDLESAMALANRKDDKTRKEFEKWAVLTYSRNQARINEKKGADGGIDGIAYFLKDRDENGKAIFQVKSRPGNRADLATLNSDRLREKAEFGFLICTSLPTKPMRDEIAAAGKYKNPLLQREDDRLQVITIAELFQGKRLDLPMARADAVKSARALGDEGNQGNLL